MTDQYHVYLEEFSLERLGQTLRTGAVLPARQVLKEDVDERFEILASMGIQGLRDLIAFPASSPDLGPPKLPEAVFAPLAGGVQ